jgi:2-amino-4-hydroxy-6-hydroxymethyldihydropteridine diphosphokinase
VSSAAAAASRRHHDEESPVILICIGSNLAGFTAEMEPREFVELALAEFPPLGAEIVARSSWYESEPVPPSDQRWYVNGVAIVTTALTPTRLLRKLLALEKSFGRIRSIPNAARTLDLDLLDHNGRLRDTPTLTLPHPRMHQRRFVLEPLCEIAPGWRHPHLGLTAAELLARLPPGELVRRLND